MTQNLDVPQCIAKLLEAKSLADMSATATLMRKEVSVTKSANLDRDLEVLATHIQANDHRKAVATVLALLLANKDSAISRMRRTSKLRASTYQFQTSCLVKVVGAALGLAPALPLKPQLVDYLESVQALHTLGSEVKRLHASLVRRVKSRSDVVLKTLLSSVHHLFQSGWQGRTSTDTDMLEYWTSEEIASAFSYILVLYAAAMENIDAIGQHVDDAAFAPHEIVYTTILIDAAKLNEFREAEALVDCLPFSAKLMGKRVSVSSIDPNLEKSIRLGYMQYEIQALIRSQGVYKEWRERGDQLPSLEKFMETMFEKAGFGRLVELKEMPKRRLVFGIPDEPGFLGLLAGDALFLDEAVQLLGLGIDEFQPKSGPTLNVSDDLIALDLAKVQRLFSVIALAFQKKLETISDGEEHRVLALRSTIALIPHAALVKIIARVLSEAKAEIIIRLLTLTGHEDHVDLQYRPFIKVGGSYVIAPAVVARSNLARNILVANRLWGNETSDENDPMINAVEQALKTAGFLIARGHTFKKLETDLLCWKDGHLFIFECKNSYHPCSAHEMRTSYGHLEKAEDQLTLRLARLQDAASQTELFNQLGWGVPPSASLHTATITANRLFSGHSIGIHPIRQAHQLINVLTHGEIGLGAGQPPIRFWRGESFQVADLIDYLEGASMINMQQEQLQPMTTRHKLGQHVLQFETYTMDMAAVATAIKDRFSQAVTNSQDSLSTGEIDPASDTAAK